MAFSDASNTRLAIIAETVAGTTPATPAFQNLRFKSESLNRTFEHKTSDEIRPDGNVTDQALVGEMASGSISAEPSYGTFDDFYEGLMQSPFASNVLKNGVMQKSFTIEKTFGVGSGSEAYHRFVGCQIGSMSFGLTSKEISDLSFELMGLGGAQDDAIITGSTYTAANTKPVLNTSSHVSGLSLTGTGVTEGLHLKSLNMSITNNLREQAEVGSRTLAGIGSGRFELSGSTTIYFENNEAIDTVAAETALALSFTIGAAANEKCTFLIPKLKLTNPRVVAGGNGQDVMAEFDFMGLYDNTEACTLKITRAVA
ncbi:MAG: hypothetical protein JKX85_02535 [Phycisphaeraceae bacterium]|nr:hypothetical protein [Phycisphaeraceae bacterium]